MRKKTIYDVAREAGVSISTVSRVINGSSKVKESTRRRVEAACVGYRTVPLSPEAQGQRTKTIGVLISHRPDSFFLNETYVNALLGASVAAREAGYRLVLDICEDESSIGELFYEHKVDGFILMGVRSDRVVLDLLRRDEIPFVLVGGVREEEGKTCQVDVDDEKAALGAMKYLIGLGHRRIGIIVGSLDYPPCRNRLEGYREAMAAAGLEVEEDWVQACDNLTEHKAEQLAKTLFYQNPRVTAVVAFNASTAMAVYKAARDCGLKIPEQLSVVGFDDATEAAYMDPPLTGVWQPSYDKGERAARLLIEGLERGGPVRKREELNCIMMYRESCAPPQPEEK